MRLGPASSKVSRDYGSEVFYPAAYGLIGNRDPTFSQQVLDIAKAEGEPGIESDGLLNDHRWEAISGVADLGHDEHLRPQFIADKPNNVTMPYRRFTAGLAAIDARLGADAVRYSFIVSDFHQLPLAGLPARRIQNLLQRTSRSPVAQWQHSRRKIRRTIPRLCRP